MFLNCKRNILRKLKKNYEITKKKRKFLGNLTLNLGKVCRKAVEF